MTRIVPQTNGNTSSNKVPKWLDTSVVIEASRSSLALQNETMQKMASQKVPMQVISYLCSDCRKTYFVNHPKLTVQANLAERAGKQVEYVCPECSSVLTPYSSTAKFADASTNKLDGLFEKRTNLQKEASGTIDTYVDRHIVYKALQELANYASKLGMSMAKPRYIKAEHRKEAGQDFPILNDIYCEIDWTYGRKQTGRVFATISVDQAGTFKFPKVFATSDGTEYPFEKPYIEALEKEANFSHPAPLRYRKTDMPVHTNPGIWNFKQSSLNNVQEESSLDDAILQVIADIAPAPVTTTTPAQPQNPGQPLQPNQKVVNPADGKEYSVINSDPQKGTTVADPQTGQQSVVPVNETPNLKPAVQTQASFQIQSMVDDLVKQCLHKNVEGEGVEVSPETGEETQEAPHSMASQKVAVAPEGWEGTVKHMKEHHDKIDNPWALSNWMKDQGDTPHYTEEGKKKEQFKDASLGKIASADLNDFLGRTFTDLDEEKGGPFDYEVYFADGYIELIKNDRVAGQYDYPEPGKTAHLQGDDSEKDGVYFNDSDNYLEFYQNDRVLYTLSFERAREVKSSQAPVLQKTASPHVATMSTNWQTQRAKLQQMHEANKKVPQVFAYKGYTPLSNSPTKQGHDEVNNVPVGESKKVEIGLTEFPKGKDRDESTGVESGKGYDIPFKDMDTNQVDDREYFHNMNKLPVNHMKREELKDYMKDGEADHNYGMSMETPDQKEINSLAIMKAMGISKIAEGEPELVKKPIQYKENKTAPKIDEFSEPATIPEASGKTKEAITKLRKAQALIATKKKELAGKLAPLQESIKTIQEPYDKALKKDARLVVSYLEMAFEQLTQTQDHIAAYDDSILAAIERSKSELSAPVTLPQLLAKAEELEPKIAEGIRKLTEVLESQRTTEVLERLLYKYPISKVQEKKIVSALESENVDWLIDELESVAQEFAAINNSLAEADIQE